MLISNMGNGIRLKTKDIEASRLISKAEFARRQGVSPTEINRQIQAGMVVIVRTIDNKELVYL